MPNGEMPDIEMTTSDDLPPDESLTLPVLLRRFVWDITPCDQVGDLLTALGLTHGSDEGMAIDHADSHARLTEVFPLEMMLQQVSEVMGSVVTTAMTEAAGITGSPGLDSVRFAEQNTEIVLSSSRAIIASLMYAGILQWGPAAEVCGG